MADDTPISVGRLHRARVLVWLAGTCAVIAGCSRGAPVESIGSGGEIIRPANAPVVHEPRYAWEFRNDTDVDIHGVGMLADTHESAGAGDLAVGHGGARESPGLDPIPARATIRWRTADGRHHEQEVEIAGRIADPKHFGGTIYFIYRRDGTWTVVPITDDEAIRRMKAGLQPWQHSGGPT
jgi:hypothetical protein